MIKFYKDKPGVLLFRDEDENKELVNSSTLISKPLCIEISRVENCYVVTVTQGREKMVSTIDFYPRIIEINSGWDETVVQIPDVES